MLGGMKTLKRLLCAAAALLLAGMLAAGMALPAFAQPADTAVSGPALPGLVEVATDAGSTTFDTLPTDTYTYTDNQGNTLLPITPRMDTVPETTDETTAAFAPYVATTAVTAPASMTLTDMLPYATLGVSLLALLLAIIALAKSGKGKKSANATGNYRNFF